VEDDYMHFELLPQARAVHRAAQRRAAAHSSRRGRTDVCCACGAVQLDDGTYRVLTVADKQNKNYWQSVPLRSRRRLARVR